MGRLAPVLEPGVGYIAQSQDQFFSRDVPDVIAMEGRDFLPYLRGCDQKTAREASY